ncbi:site-specific integrase [Nonomuraea dietziae]|uniref:site-specific integrase n=1 Tax=Nonomuraea dietziae TaxID=65515 RepID=UPI0033D4260A
MSPVPPLHSSRCRRRGRRCSRPGSRSCRRSVSASCQPPVSRSHTYRRVRRGNLIGARSAPAGSPRVTGLSTAHSAGSSATDRISISPSQTPGDTAHSAGPSHRAGDRQAVPESRRTLALPQRAVEALKAQKTQQGEEKQGAGDRWEEQGLAFASTVGTELDSHNVRRAFRLVIAKTDLDPKQWRPRELRHSFVSLLSDQGIPLQEISRLVGHSSTAVTELVYRKQIRPVIQEGATAMDRIFKS